MGVTAVYGELTMPEPAVSPAELLAALVARTPAPSARLVALIRAACNPAMLAPVDDAALYAAACAWIDPQLDALECPWSPQAFRRRSAATACAARLIAARGARAEWATAAFAAGLVLKAGQLALCGCFPKAYARAVGRAASHRDGILGAEREVLGVDHALAGKRLAEAWALPTVVRDVIWLLHQAEAIASPATHPVTAAVRRADQQVRRAAIGWPDYMPLVSPGTDPAASELAEAECLDALIEDLLVRSRTLKLPDVAVEAPALPTSPPSRVPAIGWRVALQAFLTEPVGDSVSDSCAAIAHSVQKLTGAVVAAAFAAQEGQRTWPAALVRAEVQHVRIPVQAILDRPQLIVGRPGSLAPAPVQRAPEALVAASSDISQAFAATRTVALLLPLHHDARLVGGVIFSQHDDTPAIAPDDLALLEAAYARALASALASDTQRNMAEAMAINRMQERSAASPTGFQALAAMAAGAAHELNTPLAVITGRAQMLRKGATDERARQELSVISEHAQRASTIVSELLACAKPERPHPEHFRLGPWLDRLRQCWEASSVTPAVRIDVRISDEALTIHADPQQLEEAVNAVMANAIEASPPGSTRLTINSLSRPTDDTIVVSIGDNGRGMPPEILARACDPFFSHRPAGRGRGLGLSRATRLMEINGGRLWIDSTPGQGTTVHLALPAGVPSASAC